MQVKSLQYFGASLSYHLSLRPLFCLFLSDIDIVLVMTFDTGRCFDTLRMQILYKQHSNNNNKLMMVMIIYSTQKSGESATSVKESGHVNEIILSSYINWHLGYKIKSCSNQLNLKFQLLLILNCLLP